MGKIYKVMSGDLAAMSREWARTTMLCLMTGLLWISLWGHVTSSWSEILSCFRIQYPQKSYQHKPMKLGLNWNSFFLFCHKTEDYYTTKDGRSVVIPNIFIYQFLTLFLNWVFFLTELQKVLGDYFTVIIYPKHIFYCSSSQSDERMIWEKIHNTAYLILSNKELIEYYLHRNVWLKNLHI